MYTVGSYLAARLSQIGLKHHFAVAGDFNPVLLDQLWVLNGDMPFFIGDIDLLAGDLKAWNVKGQIIAVFHGDAAYNVLNDDSYDANRIFKPVIPSIAAIRTGSSSPG